MSCSGSGAPSIIEERCTGISGEEGIYKARAILRQMMEQRGLMDEICRARLLTMIDELAKNILRHGGTGRLCIAMVRAAGHTGFRITSEDRGRGIMDLGLAFTPGYSEDSGMGMGLNLVRALSDDIRVASLLSGGALIEVWKWI